MRQWRDMSYMKVRTIVSWPPEQSSEVLDLRQIYTCSVDTNGGL